MPPHPARLACSPLDALGDKILRYLAQNGEQPALFNVGDVDPDGPLKSMHPLKASPK